MKYLMGLLCVVGIVMAEPVTVTLQDHLGRPWQHELVHYTLDFEPGELAEAKASVTLAPGGAVVSQASDVERYADGSIQRMQVWFPVSLEPNAKVEATITPGADGPTNTTLRIDDTGDTLVLSTAPGARIGIRLPKLDETYAWPAPAAEVAAPIDALLGPSGKWLGSSRMEVPFTVKHARTELVASGPLFAEARVHYTFDTGYWTFTVRVIDQEPTLIIHEAFNTGYNEQAWDEIDRVFSVVLTERDFAPSQVFYGSNNNNKPHLQNLLQSGVPEIVQTVGIRGNWFASVVRGYDLKLDEPEEHYYFSGYQSVMNRLGGAIRVIEPGSDAIGFVALNTSYWRNPMSLRFSVTDDGEFAVQMPLQVYEQHWPIDGFGRYSPNYTGKTLFVPENAARRSYGIMLSPAEDETESLLTSLTTQGSKHGALPLDTVKEWDFTIPDPMADTEWSSATSPAAQQVLQHMRDRIEMRRVMGNLSEFSMAYHHGYAKGRWGKIAAVIDDPAQLTAEDRAEIRRLAIFSAYDMNSIDTFPWGTGFHLNNPNMSIMALEARTKSSLLVKDHPMFMVWGKWSHAFLQDYLRRFTRDSGAHYENVHYSLGVTLGWAAIVNQILIDAGIGDAMDTPLFRRSIRFTFDWLTPPDPRFRGHRTAIPFGNSSYQSFPPTFVQDYVNYFKERDPELAAKLQWVANQTLTEDKQVKIMEEEIVPQLGSVHYEDYGVTFRHGFGTPYETMFAMLAGNTDGHYEWEQDQLTYTLYAKGQPINLHFGNGYFPMFARTWLRNRVSIDKSFEKSERNPTQVLAASFTPEAEYLRASRGIDMIRKLKTEYPVTNNKGRAAPEESENWPAVPEWTKIPMTIWYRQVLFVKDEDPKGPNYFVIRDGFDGTPTRNSQVSYWFLSSNMEQPAEDTYHFVGQADVNMDLFLHTPAGETPETGEYGHVQQPYVRYTGWDPDYHPDGKRQETQQFVRWEQPPGKGYMVVLYPRLKEGDPAATYERLGEGAVKVETPLSTDIVFLSPHPEAFTHEAFTYQGRAGTIRHYKDGTITLTHTDGQGAFSRGEESWEDDQAFVVTINADGTAAKQPYPAE